MQNILDIIPKDFIDFITNNDEILLNHYGGLKLTPKKLDDLFVETLYFNLYDCNIDTNFGNKYLWGNVKILGKSVYEYYIENTDFTEDYLTELEKSLEKDYPIDEPFFYEEPLFDKLINIKNTFNAIKLDTYGMLYFLPDYNKYGINIGFGGLEFFSDILNFTELLSKESSIELPYELDDDGELLDKEKGYFSNEDLALKNIIEENYNFKEFLVLGKKIKIFECFYKGITISIDEKGDFYLKDYFGYKIKKLSNTYKNLELILLKKENILNNPFLEGYVVIFNHDTNRVVESDILHNIGKSYKAIYYAINYF